MKNSRFTLENNVIITPPVNFNESDNQHGMGYSFFNNMKKFKENTAQIDMESGETETYGSILQRTIKTAIEMRKRGVTSKDIIVLCSNNHMDTCIPYIAALFLGAKLASLDPTLLFEDTVQLLNQVKPRMIFHSENATELMHNSVKQCLFTNTEIITFGDGKSSCMKFSDFLVGATKKEVDEFQPVKVDSAKTAVILFSSGTTGLPKGIEISHYMLLLSSYKMSHDGFDVSVCLGYASFYWISTVIVLSIAVNYGQCRAIAKQFAPEQMIEQITNCKISYAFIAPYQIIQVIKANNSTTAQSSTLSLKDLVVGGGPLSEHNLELVRKLFPTTNVQLAYGQTEMGGAIALFQPSSQEDMKLLLKKGNSCGRPTAGVQYKVIDPETKEILGPNKSGELLLKTKYTMNGYHNMDSSNAWDEDGWMKTGDVVYYDEDFCFYVMDRSKEMLKFQSWHVAPAKLEGILLAHPGVKDAIVIGIPDDVDGDHPMGIVIRSSDSEVTAEELVKYVEERVDDKQRLRAGVKFVEELPYTPSGKVKRKFLRENVIKGII